MVAALRLHWLDTGELPLYTIASDEFTILEVDEANPPGSTWVTRRTWGASRRALLPTNIDFTYDYFAAVLPDWILDLEETCPEGTLIFALRWSCEIEPLGRMIGAGLGWIPDVSLEGAIDLQGVRPETLIQQVCLEPRHENVAELHPAVQEMYSRLIARREAFYESETRSKQLLDRFLTPTQREELQQTAAFHVVGQDGQTYRVRARFAHNVERIEDGRPTMRYCIISKTQVPLYDQLLGQKLLLERDLDRFLQTANFLPIAADSTV